MSKLNYNKILDLWRGEALQQKHDENSSKADEYSSQIYIHLFGLMLFNNESF